MEKKIMKIKSCVISGQRNLKENICRFFTERKYISGITVIELVLILVKISPRIWGVYCVDRVEMCGQILLDIQRKVESVYEVKGKI